MKSAQSNTGHDDPSKRIWWTTAEFAKCFGFRTERARRMLQRCGALSRLPGSTQWVVTERALYQHFPDTAPELVGRLRSGAGDTH